MLADERFVLGAARLVPHQVDPLDPQLRGQPANLLRRAQAAQPRLDDDDERIHRSRRPPAQMLHTGLHIEDQGLILPQQQVGHQRLEQRALRTNAARPAAAHRAQPQQPDALMRHAEPLRDVIHLRVELEPAADRARLRAGAFIDQRLHLRNRLQRLVQFGRQAKRQPQVARRVGVNRDDIETALRVDIRQQRRQRGLADAALSRDGNFGHGARSPPARGDDSPAHLSTNISQFLIQKCVLNYIPEQIGRLPHALATRIPGSGSRAFTKSF